MKIREYLKPLIAPTKSKITMLPCESIPTKVQCIFCLKGLARNKEAYIHGDILGKEKKMPVVKVVVDIDWRRTISSE